VNERQKGGFSPGEIPDYFRAHTDGTRLLLAPAAEKDVALAELVADHAKAVQVALAGLDEFFESSRPADGSDFLRYMREEVDAVWDILRIIKTDIKLIRRLSPHVEARLPANGRQDWSKILDGADLAVKNSFAILRVAELDLHKDTKTSNEQLVTARDKAIGTLDDIRGRWSAIAITIPAAQEFDSSGKAV
jgi:hypothetical protein